MDFNFGFNILDYVKTDIHIGRFMAIDRDTYLYMKFFNRDTVFTADVSEPHRTNFLEIYPVLDQRWKGSRKYNQIHPHDYT